MRLIKPSFKIQPYLEYASMLSMVCQAISHCYKTDIPSTQKEREEFIRKRLNLGHESVIEHVGFSVDFIVNRGITHELVRHRISNFTQESTRYCSYNKDKFGGHLTYILPPFMQDIVPEGEYSLLVHSGQDGLWLTSKDEKNNVQIQDIATIIWINAMMEAETSYLHATQGNFLSSEVARDMIPHAVKAELMMSCNMRQWRTVFKQRALGKTGRPHPQMTEIMLPLLDEAKQRFPVFFEDL